MDYFDVAEQKRSEHRPSFFIFFSSFFRAILHLLLFHFSGYPSTSCSLSSPPFFSSGWYYLDWLIFPTIQDATGEPELVHIKTSFKEALFFVQFSNQLPT